MFIAFTEPLQYRKSMVTHGTFIFIYWHKDSSLLSPYLVIASFSRHPGPAIQAGLVAARNSALMRSSCPTGRAYSFAAGAALTAAAISLALSSAVVWPLSGWSGSITLWHTLFLLCFNHFSPVFTFFFSFKDSLTLKIQYSIKHANRGAFWQDSLKSRKDTILRHKGKQVFRRKTVAFCTIINGPLLSRRNEGILPL